MGLLESTPDPNRRARPDLTLWLVQGAALTPPAPAAGAVYGATEQQMLNDLARIARAHGDVLRTSGPLA